MNSLHRIRVSHAGVGHPAAGSRGWGNALRDVSKRALDVSLALASIVLLAPVMIAVALAVKLDSGGPVMFTQRRLGRGMKPFTVLKFRTMAVDSSPELHRRYIAELAESNGHGDGEMKKLTADPRVTPIGRFLRRMSLDELPQLFNVVGGSMSLVGPRPALDYELEHYRPEHFKRFEVRPGVTGLWQVSGRSSLGFHEMLDLDVEYTEEAKLTKDLSILARTPLAAVRHTA
jgi:lipopolysaccharide/colanic/teichoic acid biosynthesis glycosyltransferase